MQRRGNPCGLDLRDPPPGVDSLNRSPRLPGAPEAAPVSSSPEAPRNPFEPQTALLREWAEAGVAQRTLCAPWGALVRALVDRERQSGALAVRWDGAAYAGRGMSRLTRDGPGGAGSEGGQKGGSRGGHGAGKRNSKIWVPSKSWVPREHRGVARFREATRVEAIRAVLVLGVGK